MVEDSTTAFIVLGKDYPRDPCDYLQGGILKSYGYRIIFENGWMELRFLVIKWLWTVTEHTGYRSNTAHWPCKYP